MKSTSVKEMTLKEVQDFFMSRHGKGDRDVSKHMFMTILMEEVGELATELLEGNSNQGIGAELADILFVVFCLANKLDIDIMDEMEEKYFLELKEKTNETNAT